MTKKEFLRGLKKTYRHCHSYHWNIHTCWCIEIFLGIDARLDYQQFIDRFLDKNSYLEEIEMRPKLRMLLLQSFKEEVLSTGIYKNFQEDICLD